MLSEARDQIRAAPWLSVFPGLAIFFTVLGLNLGRRVARHPRPAIDHEARMTDAPLFQVDDLHVTLRGDGTTFNAVENVSFEIDAAEAFGLVGGSGCGKSIRRLPSCGYCAGPSLRQGPIVLERRGVPASLGRPPARAARQQDRHDFQEPMTALNSLSPVGRQIARCSSFTRKPRRRGDRRAADALRQAACPRPSGASVSRIDSRRHAPARHDRGCARLPSRPPDRRPAERPRSTSRCRPKSST